AIHHLSLREFAHRRCPPCSIQMTTLAPLLAQRRRSSLLPTTRAAHSAQTPTRMKIGPRFQILLRDVEFRIELPRGITVRLLVLRLAYAKQRGIIQVADKETGRKIKSRLEDLERRASSPEGSPEHVHTDLAPQQRVGQRSEGSVKRPRSKSNKASAPDRKPSSRHPARQHPHDDVDEYSSLFHLQPMRDLSTSPTPQLSYPYAHAESIGPVPYVQSSSFQHLPASFPEYSSQSYYLPPLPTTLPSMPSYDLEPMKPDTHFEDDGMLGHMNHHIPYGPYGGLEIPQAQSYQDANVHVNDYFFYP
ncbi:MAG: hypothetical protein L6R40_002466, partial [Gallowayella cf. fulva]